MPPALTDRAPKMYIANRKTKNPNGGFDRIEAHGNPPTLSGETKVAYNRVKIPGMSHQVMQFSNTENFKTPLIDFEFYGDTAEERDKIKELLNTWQSWLYPAPADNIRGGAPPRLLFCWPNIMSMEVVITDWKFHMKEFSIDGDPSWLVISCSFEQISDKRILPDDIWRVGLLRDG